MNITSGIFKLAKTLPQKPAIILCQSVVLIYLLIKKNYRTEIKTNYQKIFGFYQKGFWFRQSRRLGKNLSLMLQISKSKKILDKTQIYGENILCNLTENNRKAVIVSFHYGLWEFLPQIFQKLGYEISISIGTQRNQNLAYQLYEFRNRNGVKIVETISEMRDTLKSNVSSNRKKLLGFVLDNTNKTRGLSLNKPWTGFTVLRTPFILAKSTKTPILAMFCYIQNNNIVVDIDEINNPQEMGNLLWSYIEKNPEEWVFWGKNEKEN